MRFRKPHVHRHQACFRTEPEQREQKGDRSPCRIELRCAHGIESELPTAALQDAEAQQDGNCADVSDEQVEKAGAANFRNAMLRRDQEVGRQRHRLPGEHESVRIVGQQHEPHAGKKQVILQAHQARRRAFAAAEVASGKDRNARRGGAQQKQKRGRQAIEAQMNRQVGQTDGQHGLFR